MQSGPERPRLEIAIQRVLYFNLWHQAEVFSEGNTLKLGFKEFSQTTFKKHELNLFKNYNIKQKSAGTSRNTMIF